MIVKQVFLGKDGHEKLRKGIDTLHDAVASTLGPYGQTVLMESESHVGGTIVTKDGVTVAKTINLYDPVENLAINIVKEAADKTAKNAGDGTTTSIVLTKAFIDSADEYITDKHNKTNVIRNINKVVDSVISYLTKKSKAVKGNGLLDIATISANNDPELGKIIADTFSEVSVVTVENSKTPITYSEIIDGMRIERGWTSKYFVNNEKSEECVLENPYVLLTDLEINNMQSIVQVLEPVIKSGKPLLIIGNLSANAQNTLNLNVMKGVIKACHVLPPSMGYRREDLMKDLSIGLGARLYTEKTGDDLQLITFDGLGKAAKVIVSKDRTIIMRHQDMDTDGLDAYVGELKEAMKSAQTQIEREDYNNRIANLNGGIGVVYVGANTSIEQKEKYDRADDAVRAVGAAIEEGILPGGGIALARASEWIRDNEDDDDYQCAVDIVKTALVEPIRRIMLNAGLDPLEVCSPVYNKAFTYGYDVKNHRYGNMITMGVVDPALVTKSALKNAVSVATTIISTEAIVTNMRDGEGSK